MEGFLDIREGRGFLVKLTGSGKFKRLPRYPRVTIAPCDRRADVTGSVRAGTIRVLYGRHARCARASLVAQFGWQAYPP
jgi:hypothetical protein